MLATWSAKVFAAGSLNGPRLQRSAAAACNMPSETPALRPVRRGQFVRVDVDVYASCATLCNKEPRQIAGRNFCVCAWETMLRLIDDGSPTNLFSGLLCWRFSPSRYERAYRRHGQTLSEGLHDGHSAQVVGRQSRRQPITPRVPPLISSVARQNQEGGLLRFEGRCS